MGEDTTYNNVISLQRPSSDRRLRKASDQPSGHSQVTESSGSTPESCPDLSDEDFVPGKWLQVLYTLGKSWPRLVNTLDLDYQGRQKERAGPYLQPLCRIGRARKRLSEMST